MSRSCLAPLLAVLLVAAPLPASALDWNAVADTDTVVVLTTDDTGEPAEITVWLAVVDGQGYLRTGNTSWRPYVEADPEIGLRIGEAEHPLRATRVDDPALVATVVASFREKYGFSDWLIGLFRGGDPLILRLDPR